MELRRLAAVLPLRTVSVLKIAPEDQDAVVGTAAPRQLAARSSYQEDNG